MAYLTPGDMNAMWGGRLGAALQPGQGGQGSYFSGASMTPYGTTGYISPSTGMGAYNFGPAFAAAADQMAQATNLLNSVDTTLSGLSDALNAADPGQTQSQTATLMTSITGLQSQSTALRGKVVSATTSIANGQVLYGSNATPAILTSVQALSGQVTAFNTQNKALIGVIGSRVAAAAAAAASAAAASASASASASTGPPASVMLMPPPPPTAPTFDPNAFMANWMKNNQPPPPPMTIPIPISTPDYSMPPPPQAPVYQPPVYNAPTYQQPPVQQTVYNVPDQFQTMDYSPSYSPDQTQMNLPSYGGGGEMFGMGASVSDVLSQIDAARAKIQGALAQVPALSTLTSGQQPPPSAPSSLPSVGTVATYGAIGAAAWLAWKAFSKRRGGRRR